MPPRRLPAAAPGDRPPASATFRFDGMSYEGHEGEPLAVSLLAAGRRTLSRSFRFHRPRGLMCSTGQCGWCECEVDGRPSVRTCRIPLRDGMVVRGEHAWPSVEHDLLAVLDLGSRFVPPTFYHHRFLRPRFLRKAYLDVLRSLGGRGRLASGPRSDRPVRTVHRDDPDVLVVGGGRSGLGAAMAAARAGARVVVLEAEADLDREGSARRPALSGLLAAVRQLGVEVRLGTTAIGWYGGTVTAIGHDALLSLSPKAVVAATGTYELIPNVPGSDRPGVMSARLVSTLVTRHRVLPGERALLVGEGEEVESAAAVLRASGAAVVGPIATSALLGIAGRGRVASVRIRAGGVGPGARREAVDLVAFGDRTPNLDLVLAAGAEVGWRAGRLAPLLDGDGRTTVAGLFVAGAAAGATDGLDARGADPDRVGRAASRAARATAAWAAVSASDPPAQRGDPPRSRRHGHPPAPPAGHAILCFCEDVRAWEVAAERGAGYRHPELLKRRTGALTGPCQGKYCLSAVTCAMSGHPDRVVADASDLGATEWGGDNADVPTARPPLRPVRLGDLAAEDPP